jgi:ABC-type sugar transport system permease subunit
MQPSPVPPPPPFPPPPPPAQRSDATRITVGLLLVVPATIALIIGYLVPTVRTAIWSLQERTPLTGRSEWRGFDNYERMFDDPLGPLSAIGYTLLLALAPLLVVLVVAPLLALVANAGGRPARLMVRLGLTIPTVCFAPVALAAAWLIDRYPTDGSARVTVWLAVALTLFGLLCGLGVTVFLAVLRGGAPGRSVWPATLTVGGLGFLAVLAVALQTFTYPYVMTRGGPLGQTRTPMLSALGAGLQFLDLGYGAAAATLVLVPVLLLGLAAGLLVVFSRLRIEPVAPAAPDRTRAWAVVVAALGLLVVLAVTLYGLWPWLTELGNVTVEGAEEDTATAIVNTWLPPIVSTVIGVGLAAVAGFGIGALRPAGRYSELLLLPFAPWLFVSIGPLWLVKWIAADTGDRLDTFLGRIPPIWLAVPALFVFTLLFRGLAGRPLGSILLRALPMVGLVGAATWLVQSQSLLWGLIVSLSEPNAQVLVVQWLGQFGTSPEGPPLGMILPIPAIVVFAVGLCLLHVLYLDRLAIRAGRVGQTGPDDRGLAALGGQGIRGDSPA